MNCDVPLVANQQFFPVIPDTTKLAILLPTARWSPVVRSIIASLVGVASEEIVVLIADNSENQDKRQFLTEIRRINPNVIAVAHERNIGALGNFLYLHEWSKRISYSALMADDDWVSPEYHVEAYKALSESPSASCAEAGATLVDFGDGYLRNISHNAIVGDTAIDRIRQWNGMVARVTMYNVSRRPALDAAIRYLRATPLNGITLIEDLWELSRLAQGNFLKTAGHGSYLHYPYTGGHMLRIYEGLYKEANLQYPFVYFGQLSTAIQLGIFLTGKLSPIVDPEQKRSCGQHVFGHIFRDGFLSRFLGDEREASLVELAPYSLAMDGVATYCTPAFAERPILDRKLIDWFIEIIKAFETKTETDCPPLSERFGLFVDSLACDYLPCQNTQLLDQESLGNSISSLQQNDESFGIIWLLKKLIFRH